MASIDTAPCQCLMISKDVVIRLQEIPVLEYSVGTINSMGRSAFPARVVRQSQAVVGQSRDPITNTFDYVWDLLNVITETFCHDGGASVLAGLQTLKK